MIHSKSNGKLDNLDGARSDLTFWTAVRTVALANLLVATLVLFGSCGIALVDHDPKTFQLGLWLVPFVTPVVWASAALLYVLEVAPRWLGALGRRLAGRSRSLPARSGVWDDWLDSPN